MEKVQKIRAADVRLCMSQNWRMRNDRQRIVLYKYSTEESEWRVVPPQIGVALSLFDGEKTIAEVTTEMESLFKMATSDARVFMTEILATFHARDPVLIDSLDVPDQDWCVYDPADMIIPHDDFQPEKRLEAPLSLLLMPFNTCDVDCRYCYAERKPIRNVMPIDRWRTLLEEAAEADISLVTFSGGDPMRHPQIMQLLDILIEHDFLFLMSTKSLITDDMARRLSEIGLGNRMFQISVDALTPDLANYMVRRKDYFDRAMESIRNLVRHGIQVRTNSVCTPDNYLEAPDLVKSLHDMGVTKSTVTVYGRSMFRHDDSMFVSEEQLEWLRDKLKAVNEDFPDADVSFNGAIIDHNSTSREEKENAWSGRANCSGGMSSMTICADGRVILCEQMPHEDTYTAGNLATQGLLEVWNSQQMLDVAFPSRDLFKGTVCYDCGGFDECHKEKGYCFRDALNSYGSIYMPPPNCPQAPPSVRLG